MHNIVEREHDIVGLARAHVEQVHLPELDAIEGLGALISPLDRIEHGVLDLDGLQVLVAVDHRHWVVVEQRLDSHIVLVDVHEEGGVAADSRQALQRTGPKVPEDPFELLDAIVELLVSDCCLIRDEFLKQLLIADQHVDEGLAQVSVLRASPAKVEVQRPAHSKLG